MILAATILHDIGKLRELDYHPVETKYTKEGCLIGHVLMGRDLVRDAARKIDGFPEETLLLLEHAILRTTASAIRRPIVPQTLEALLVSFVDDLDAKMNIAAVAALSTPRVSSPTRSTPSTTAGFTREFPSGPRWRRRPLQGLHRFARLGRRHLGGSFRPLIMAIRPGRPLRPPRGERVIPPQARRNR